MTGRPHITRMLPVARREALVASLALAVAMKWARQQLGYSREGMADFLQISTAAYRNYENRAAMPSPENERKLRDMLALSDGEMGTVRGLVDRMLAQVEADPDAPRGVAAIRRTVIERLTEGPPLHYRDIALMHDGAGAMKEHHATEKAGRQLEDIAVMLDYWLQWRRPELVARKPTDVSSRVES